MKEKMKNKGFLAKVMVVGVCAVMFIFSQSVSAAEYFHYGNTVITAKGEAWGEGLSIDSPPSIWGGIKWRRTDRNGYTGNWHLGLKGGENSDALFFTDNDGDKQKDIMVLRHNGNVGIGTTSPLSGLGWVSPGMEVSGSRGTLGLTTTVPGGISTLRLKGPSAGSEMHWNFTDGINPRFELYSYAGGRYMFSLEGDGDVGIGVSHPDEKLEVAGNIKLSGNIVSDGDICIGNCN